MAEAELARFIDRFTVEYVRTYPHPIERVWRAITDPKELGRWFIHGSTLELAVGGAYRFEGDEFAGKVRALDPPRFIRFGGADDADPGFFQYELSEAPGGGTRMRFIQHFDPAGAYAPVEGDLGGDLPVPGTPWMPGFVGGWHEFWDALGDYLDGVLTGSRLPKTEFSALVDSFVAKTVKNGRMTPENGQRIALGLRREERWNELNKIYRAHIPQAVPPAEGA
jgi:uncharacterized protein YndB with AHSA1/START domain